ncbi:BREX-1 system adenine-specific DNA-methyltransferase PglX [Bacillus paralicheniformis]|uniref:BREX-1 system adenine-specific DNA-methyltransferase PglX n=1 Tax=Bacillus paralicheniformis TaxID=1648923 RepID=UPI002243DBBB|nr:BREX-1 system adenine-specific DNA-methyltransferase PglX [Bacillus paralicheniformis]MEC1023195.1 BREX-1 system adenine-specific DNA-methyltransferase PglX [Bacillus paralicheniformis]MEC1025761.1 BREX-1 system adenine-specific DNA-methyltransferase PglX [Bacillus paralicheniformis]MEC1035823.1 BREX-1 system adenine-specific DNA-methyltransferase PglX [Bacillus paralicheniformis]MEC1050039.1 BREX-1 system adenine-specific DNA-methyltransferase PglX [Bacillus paralicheniformis]MEC1060297.1 
MNKTALKTFATNARRELLKKVEARAMKIGITEDNIKKADIESSDAIFIDGRQLSKEEKTQRDRLIDRIKQIGFKRVMEEVSYTWFNRFTALRFMEVNDYLPTKVRVLSSTNADSTEPDMMKEVLSLDLDLDKEYIYNLKMNNSSEELFKYLIIKHCNDLNRYMPFMFETIDDYSEILFPEGLLATDSFLRYMTNTEVIPEDNWKEIEVIGWLYQYYIAEEKDRVFKEKKKYKAEEIPFATQLFTPDWIVRYMVQNSLGRYWVEAHPEHRELLNDWEFYLEYEQEDFQDKIAPFVNKELNVEEIKCFDPAMGSGHILVYAFDVFYEIYSKCGYMEREIPRLIIENNLYGLDIDDRAYQLACFSVVMKALKYNRRFLRNIERDGLKLNLASVQETNSINEEDIAYFAGEQSGENYQKSKAFIDQFRDGKTLGSIIKVTEKDIALIQERLEKINASPAIDLFGIEKREKILSLFPKLIKQNQIMGQKYEVLVTNPPYMGSRYMNPILSKYLNTYYPNSKSDLFATFMELDHYLKEFSFYASINQHAWMFLSSFEKLRESIIANKSIENMLHLGSRAFEEIGGEVVQSAAFVLRNLKIESKQGVYIRLLDQRTATEKKDKAIEAVQNPSIPFRYQFKQEYFGKIPGSPIVYWSTQRVRDIFNNESKLSDIADPKTGIQTGNNNVFLRNWFEVSIQKVGLEMSGFSDINKYGYKWFPYNKGGEFRKWYGNNDVVINMENEGEGIKNFSKKSNYRLREPRLYFKEAITWSFISSSRFGVRYSPPGFLFDVAGSSVFPKKEDTLYLTAFLCSKLAFEFLKLQNPTLNFQVENIAKLPIIIDVEESLKKQIDQLSQECIQISKNDWNSFETSWEFKKHPLISMNKFSVQDSFKNWKDIQEERFFQLKSKEEKLNELFIDIYSLNNEISPIVEDDDITINKSDLERDIKSLISYAVGCSFGRYSLDEDGLVYAGGEFDHSRYKTFKADKDNILSVLPGSYFEDDIVSRFIDFIRVTFGEETLSENLEFITGALGRKKGETPKETLRRYFLNDFYKDHLKTYSKRPIYWLFTSGKEKAFNCIIYMHRYDKTTLSRIRTDYLHDYQIRLDAEKEDLLNIIEGDSTAKEISNAKKELKALDKKIEELKAYDELLHHMADMQIEIDLDDGVKVNYEKFKGLVAKL